MEYDYEFMWDYEISVHDDLDENVYTYADSTRTMQDEKALTFRH